MKPLAETERVRFERRSHERIKEILEAPVEEQMEFFGKNNDEQLQSKLNRLRRGLDNWKMILVYWNIIDKETGRTIGSVGFHSWYVEHERAELGYNLHNDFQGKGLMTEILKRVLAYGFNEMQLNRVEAFVSPDNMPSIALMKKFGFVREGLLRQHFKTPDGAIHDSAAFGLLKGEFSGLGL